MYIPTPGMDLEERRPLFERPLCHEGEMRRRVRAAIVDSVWQTQWTADTIRLAVGFISRKIDRVEKTENAIVWSP